MPSTSPAHLPESDLHPATITPAWMVCAWPPVLWQATSAPALNLVHLGTCVLSFGDAFTPCAGQTLWGEASNDRSTGVAWDWVEVYQGVVAMSDPLGVVTNLRLLERNGEVMDQNRMALHLGQLVHGLPWQHEVRRALEKPF